MTQGGDGFVPEGDVTSRLRHLEAAQADLRRKRLVVPNARDLRDFELSKVTDGQVAVYRHKTGKWYPLSIVPPFDHPGAVTVAISDPWPPLCNTRVRRLYLRLKTAGTTATTARLLKNGTAVSGASVTLAAAALTGGVSFDVTYLGPEADYAQLEVTAAGAGAQGLMAQVY